MFNSLGFPYVLYKEYPEERTVPSNESLQALSARCFGKIGSIPRPATTSTQAFTEKCIVRASKRKGFAAPACGAAGGGAADLELEPELRALTLSLDAEGEDLMSGLLG